MAEGAVLCCGVLCEWKGGEGKEDQEMGSKKYEYIAERSGSCWGAAVWDLERTWVAFNQGFMRPTHSLIRGNSSGGVPCWGLCIAFPEDTSLELLRAHPSARGMGGWIPQSMNSPSETGWSAWAFWRLWYSAPTDLPFAVSLYSIEKRLEFTHAGFFTSFIFTTEVHCKN